MSARARISYQCQSSQSVYLVSACQLVSCLSSCVPVPDYPFHLFLASLLSLFIPYRLELCNTSPPPRGHHPSILLPQAASTERSLHNLQLCLSSPCYCSIHPPPITQQRSSKQAPNISRHRGPATHLFPADPPGEAPTHSRRFSLVPSPCCRVVRPSTRHPSSIITLFLHINPGYPSRGWSGRQVR